MSGGQVLMPRGIGLWTRSDEWPADRVQRSEIASQVEEFGFRSIWLGVPVGYLDLPGHLLEGTRDLTVATGVLDVWRSEPTEARDLYVGLDSRFPGRFALGLGLGHAVSIEAATEHRYVRPFERLGCYLDRLDSGEPAVKWGCRVLAALGPRSVAVARDRAAGAHSYLVTPEHTAQIAKVLGPDRYVIPEQKVVLSRNASEARAAGRSVVSGSLQLPNYIRHLRLLGFSEEDVEHSGSDRLIDHLVAWGSPDAIRSRVQEHFEAGATQVSVQVLPSSGTAATMLASWRVAAELLIAG
jgi:probable F420-dependent oxidoreductase